MHDPAEKCRRICSHLIDLGVEVATQPGAISARGELLVSAHPFPCLDGNFRVSRARFYTLGAKHIKFSHPSAFFDLSALDVSRCRSSADVERELRHSWDQRVRELRATESWLGRIGAETQLLRDGTRLGVALTGVDGPPALVNSETEILLPSSHALAERGVATPAARQYRPQATGHASDLEVGITQALEQVAADAKTERAPRAVIYSRERARDAATDSRVKHVDRASRVLLLDDDTARLAIARAALQLRGFDPRVFKDANRALESFRTTSYELALVGVRLSRGDGLEFTSSVLNVSGIERLPVVLLDERENDATARAAGIAGAAAYLAKPFNWQEVVDTLETLIEHGDQRRYSRYPAQLAVTVEQEPETTSAVTTLVARGGFCLLPRREVPIGTVQRYRVEMPPPLAPVAIEGVVVMLDRTPGRARVPAGVRFLRFDPGHEARWICLIEALDQRR